MNEGAIFIIGIIVFAITVWGTVMAGGMVLTKAATEQEPAPREVIREGDASLRTP